MVGTSWCQQKVQQSPYNVNGKFPTRWERKSYKLQNFVYNSLYPVQPLHFFFAAVATISVQYKTLPNSSQITILNFNVDPNVYIIMVSLIICYTPIWLLRFFLKTFYFNYKGYLFEKRNDPSLTTKFWGFCRHLLTQFSTPRLSSCESLLPKLPVPNLDDTIARYLRSVEPLYTEKEFLEVSSMAQQFLTNEGKWLQRIVKLYSFFVTNYVTGFWEKYAYLYSRSGLLINSSVAHCDLFEDIPARQSSRAAHITYIEALSMLSIDKEALKPISGGLICICHLRKCYAMTRLPGKDIDCWKSYGLSRHVLVLYNGRFYQLEVFDKNNQIYSVEHLTMFYDEILNDSDESESNEKYVAALTTDKREKWFKNRQKFFLENPVNKKTLEVIESAMFVIILDDYNLYGYDKDSPEQLDTFMSKMLTGDGANRWADKSLNYTVAANGRCGGTTEHSVADGAEFDYIMENFAFTDVKLLDYSKDDVYSKNHQRKEMLKDGTGLPKRLKFDISLQMAEEAKRCYNEYQKQKDDADCKSWVFTDFGKGFIKKGGISPDAFVQMAIQLANYKDQGKFALTYESASTRFYAESRTETLRVVTKESCAFVKSMLDSECATNKRLQLLREASAVHAQHNRECMVGKGIDRHLFVLLVLSKMLRIKSPFLDHYIAQQWSLSTSQAPNMTSRIDEDIDVNYSWLGAAFGAVAKSGYGICYRFAGNHSICIHITSYKSAKNTDSIRFRKRLIESLRQIATLLESLSKSG